MKKTFILSDLFIDKLNKGKNGKRHLIAKLYVTFKTKKGIKQIPVKHHVVKIGNKYYTYKKSTDAVYQMKEINVVPYDTAKFDVRSLFNRQTTVISQIKLKR